MVAWLNTFRIRLTILFGGLSMLIGLGVTIYIDKVASSRMTEARGEVLQGLAQSIANTLGADLLDREREIILLSRLPSFTRGSLGGMAVRESLKEAKRAAPEYAWIGVADSDGKVLADADDLLQGVDVSKRPWFKHGKIGSYVGDVHEAVLLAEKLGSPNPNEPLRFLDFVAPITDGQGHLRGVLGIHAHWSWVTGHIQGMLPKAAAQSGVEIIVADKKGNILYPREGMNRLELPKALPEHGRFEVMAWAGAGDFLTSRAIMAASNTSDLGWQIVVRQPINRALAPIIELHRTLLLIGGVVAALFMALSYRLAERFSGPVVQLAQVARRIEQGDEVTPFADPSRIKEIHDLAESLRGMTTTLLRRRTELENVNQTLERKVEERTADLADLYNNAPVGYHSCDADGVIRQMNVRELAMLGYQRSEVVDRMHVTQLLAKGEQSPTWESMARLRTGDVLPAQDAEMVRKDGSPLPVRLSSTAVFDEQGKVRMIRTAVMDVSDLKEVELAFRRQQILNEAIVHASTNGLLLYRENGECVLANEAAAEIVGATVEQLLKQNFHHIASWKRSGWYEAALSALRGRQTQLTVSTMSTFGKPLDALLNLVPLRHDDQTMLLVVLKDVSELMAANRELEQLARRDTLTGLYNRLAANERLREEFLRMKRTGNAYAVLLLDIDHFKRVNDTLGHETGDQVLQHVAARLAGEARSTDFVARFGGEEFMVLLPDTTQDGAMVAAEKIRLAVCQSPAPRVGQITVSVGVAVTSEDDGDEDNALRRADLALYRAKGGGRNRIAI